MPHIHLRAIPRTVESSFRHEVGCAQCSTGNGAITVPTRSIFWMPNPLSDGCFNINLCVLSRLCGQPQRRNGSRFDAAVGYCYFPPCCCCCCFFCCCPCSSKVGACFWGLPLPEDGKTYDIEPGGSIEVILDNTAVNGAGRGVSQGACQAVARG